MFKGSITLQGFGIFDLASAQNSPEQRLKFVLFGDLSRTDVMQLHPEREVDKGLVCWPGRMTAFDQTLEYPMFSV